MASSDDVRVQEAIKTSIPERPDIEPNWEDVMQRLTRIERAAPLKKAVRLSSWRGRPRSRQRLRHRLANRRLVVAAVVIVALAGAALAVAAGEGWWFEQPEIDAPNPAHGVLVVAEGTWNGRGWTLTAYGATGGAVCYALTPVSTEGTTPPGAAFSCAHVGRPPSGQAEPHYVPLTALMNAAQVDFPGYVVGPVIDEATRIRIRLSDGRALETKTLAAPRGFDLALRFFAVPLPCSVSAVRAEAFDDHGTVLGRIELSQPGPPARPTSTPCA
jgi:hypothetical protein